MHELGQHRWALVAAHPGHELRAFHFLELTRPVVAVLTDGSGAHGVSRLDQTTRVLGVTGAMCSPIYGRFTDREIYAHLMDGHGEPFLDVANRLSETFKEHRVTAVLTDAAEGFNPVHDVCRGLTEAAIGLCGPVQPLLFEVDLVGHPDGDGSGIRLHLDDGAFARKLDAVDRYAELLGEADSAFGRFGVDAFRTEFLRRSEEGSLAPAEHAPHYDVVGAERVRQGRYRTALRYREHVRPILDVLRAAGRTGTHAATVSSLH